MTNYSTFTRKKTSRRINYNVEGFDGVLKFSHVWKLENFGSLSHEKGELIKSAIFSPKEKEAMKWRLTVYPRGEKLSEENHVAVYLRLLSFVEDQCYATCELSIINDKKKVFQKSFEDFHPFLCTGKGWGFKNFISMNTIMKSKDKFLPGNHIYIACKVTVLMKAEAQKVSMTTFGNGLQTDVKIVVNGEIFEVHQWTLAARSPIFALMFKRAKYKEGNKIRIDIDDVDAKSFRDLMRSIYMANAANMIDTGYMFKTEIAKRFKVN
ncbi:speckle-type POZ protein B-like protein [Leptotrombidium deliense]|uniref:Speckle-type POZ protein B-like protein n=1 Tax=Leptotrombidium deliense TaxID=299467 RepID=A0A443SBJ0_9ACAR|nr:speckle-type POZ protein B-like protein [Leptotrombidium deliense]